MFRFKYYIAGFIGAIILLAGFYVVAAPQNVGNILRNVTPEADLTYYLGTSTARWLGLEVGNVTSTNICLGSDCISAWSEVGGSTTFLATTTATFDGQITTSTLTGYYAANDVCAYEYADSHICTDGEIMSYIASGGDTSSWGADVSTAWYSEVAPGYLANANDCNGFTSNSNTYLGAFYVFNATDGGYGVLVNCSNSKPLTCCK